MQAKLQSCLNQVRRILLPLTAFFTVGVVSYISYAYLWDYIPSLSRYSNDFEESQNSDGETNISADPHMDIPWYAYL